MSAGKGKSMKHSAAAIAAPALAQPARVEMVANLTGAIRDLGPKGPSDGADGYLYFTANQLYRQPGFHQGKDRRRPPDQLLRVKIGAGPVLLK